MPRRSNQERERRRAEDERQRQRAVEAERRRQRAVSEQARERVNQGRWFHLGMAAIRGETRENGWTTEHAVRTLEGIRRHDTARVIDPTDKRFAEYKSGRTPANEALDQLKKDRELLDRGWSGTFIRVQGVRFERKLERELTKLAKEYPDQFDVVFVSREQAKIAVDKGRQLEQRERDQLSLFDETKIRQKELRRRELERMKEIKRTREAADKAEKAAKEKRAREEKERQQRERDAAAEQARQQRAREEQERQQQGRNLTAAEQAADARTREEADRAAAHERERQAREAREAYERAREQLPRELREIADLHRLTFPAPGDGTHGGPRPHNGQTRAGRESRARGRERDGRERER